MSNGLPDYIAAARPNPPDNRAPWYKNTAPAYAGIFLWFVFWLGATQAPNAGGVLSHGIWAPIVSLLLAALLCHTFYYVILGIMGQKTGLPLYIVGTSTFGATGGFIMPGFLMGVLQFGWLGVNTYFSSDALSKAIFSSDALSKTIPVNAKIIMVVWGAAAAFVGLKGIQYVARVATYLPLIPLITLIVLFLATVGGLGSFDASEFVALHKTAVPTAPTALSSFGVVAFIVTYVVGFFATAGAAGVDFGTNSRDERDVHMGGFVGIAVAIIVTAGLATLILAGAYGKAGIAAVTTEEGKMAMSAYDVIPAVLGTGLSKVVYLLLAIAAFPAACFSAFVAANSFKATLPKVNPFVSVGIGAVAAIIIAVMGWAADLTMVFNIIGASFGPICGAMAVDYMLNKCRWAGPRKGFNPAGWLAWGFGFVIGIMPNLGIPLPMAPVWAMVAGAVVYWIAAKAGMESEPMPFSPETGEVPPRAPEVQVD